MAKPVKNYKFGKISVAKFESEYNGQKTESFAAPQKSYKDKNGKWQNTNFLTSTDLRDAIFVYLGIILEQFKTSGAEIDTQPSFDPFE